MNYATAPSSLSYSGSLLGFISVARLNASTVLYRAVGNNGLSTNTSTAPLNTDITVFANTSLTAFSNARISFYSIGEYINQTLFDSRVTTLMNAFTDL
jgi:hypothetical protein